MNPLEEIRQRTIELRSEFGDLLDETTLERIALDERGLLMTNKKNISELRDREEASLEVKVKKTQAIREFKKRDGGAGRVRNLDIEDETGTCRLVLWDEDVEMPEKLGIREGTGLKLINCYVKHTDFGLDVSKGKKGKIEPA
jgi:ssDNA-binding replication factor A large subunit